MSIVPPSSDLEFLGEEIFKNQDSSICTLCVHMCACVHLCAPCACRSIQRDQNRVLDLLEVELVSAERCHMDPGSQTQDFCKSSKYSSPLRRLSSPAWLLLPCLALASSPRAARSSLYHLMGIGLYGWWHCTSWVTLAAPTLNLCFSGFYHTHVLVLQVCSTTIG